MKVSPNSPKTQPTGLGEIELLNLDERGRPPKGSRLTDVGAAEGIFLALYKADEKSAVNRSRLQAMFDGAPPYDPAVLRSTNQSSRCNLNFGEARRFLDLATSGYVDLIASVENLVQVSTTHGESADRTRYESVIAEELTRVLREWPEFYTTYLRMVNEFVIHGIGVTYFEDERDFRFRSCGLSDFLIPRQTQASEHAVEVACAKRKYMVHELYAFIDNPELAAKRGWDVDEVRRVIRTACSSYSSRHFSEWEDVQRELKNNDIYTGIRANEVSVVNMWVREFDGAVSHYMFSEHTPKTFMLRRTGRFQSPEQAFVLFTYGVGTNGTYHSVRGLGHRIYNHVQTSNRLQCQMVDSAMLSSSVMLLPETPRALNDLSLTYYGAFSVLPPNFRVIEKAVPNLTQTVGPALQNITAQLNDNLDFYSNKGALTGSPYRSKMQVQAELEQATRLTSSQINQFYASWRRLVREVVRRITSGRNSDPAVREFYRRCAERGVPDEAVAGLDHAKTVATRAVGGGNATNRAVALDDIESLMPMLDEYGRRNVVYDRVAARVGYENADRYVQLPDAPRLPQDAKIAELENAQLQLGTKVSVLPNELHLTHLSVHQQFVTDLSAAIDSGQADLAASLPVLEAYYEHCGQHIDAVSGDPAAAGQLAQAAQVQQQLYQKLINANRAAQKAQQAQQGGAEQPQGATEQDAKLEIQRLKLQELQLKMEFAKSKAELELQLRQAKAQQEQALTDARMALELSKS